MPALMEAKICDYHLFRFLLFVRDEFFPPPLEPLLSPFLPSLPFPFPFPLELPLLASFQGGSGLTFTFALAFGFGAGV